MEAPPYEPVEAPHFDPTAPSIWESSTYELNISRCGLRYGTKETDEGSYLWQRIWVLVDPVGGPKYDAQLGYGLDRFFVSVAIPTDKSSHTVRKVFYEFCMVFGIEEGTPLTHVGPDDKPTLTPEVEDLIINTTDVMGYVDNEPGYPDTTAQVNTVSRWGAGV